MQSNQRFISYGAHKRFRRLSWEMAVYGLVPKKFMGWIAQAYRSYTVSVKNKHLKFINELFSKSRISDCPPDHLPDRPPLVITIPHSLNGWGVKIACKFSALLSLCTVLCMWFMTQNQIYKYFMKIHVGLVMLYIFWLKWDIERKMMS